ncbi:MAG: prepilin peptidase [Synergistaceae bacterium]|jgi:leader peptidase (prepilin peptidase)/N-methyltransferase|nr:prepilin peptidase [Synergistaceae bacterium]
MNETVFFLVIFSALLGASLGSFLNVVAHRSVSGRPWWGKERSVCEACGKGLTFWELIPLVSWLLQKGRCRSCGARLSPRYLIVELIGAAAAALAAWRWGVSWAYVFVMVGSFGLFLNALTDYETQDVFDAFTLSLGIAGLLLRLAGGWGALADGLLGAAAGWGVFAVIIFATRGGMGWGDAFLMGGAGALLGWKMTALAFYLGIMAGGVSVAYLMLRGRVKWGRGDAVPLAPSLAVGCFLTFLWGPEILRFIGLRFQFALTPGWPWTGP